MILRIVLIIACCASLPLSALSRQILMTCDVTHDKSGERMHRTVIIDPDRRIVHDDAITFTDGVTSPLSNMLEGFVDVDVDGKRVAWGNRNKSTGTKDSVFVLDLVRGDYVFTSRFRGRLSHGTCQHGEMAT